MEKLSYVKLEMQDYLKQNSISSIGGRTVFRYRTHMASYRQNFGSCNGPITCPLCGLHIDNQSMAFNNCPVIKDNVKIEGKYEDIFRSSVSSDLVRTLVNIEKFRKENIWWFKRILSRKEANGTSMLLGASSYGGVLAVYHC